MLERQYSGPTNPRAPAMDPIDASLIAQDQVHHAMNAGRLARNIALRRSPESVLTTLDKEGAKTLMDFSKSF